MKRFSIRPSLVAIVFYLLLLVAWFYILMHVGKDYWYAGLAPWYGLGLIFLLAGTRYKLRDDILVVRNPFERKVIPLASIEHVEEIHNPLWKRMITGFPPYSLRLTYAEQQTLIHANTPETIHSLRSKVNPVI